MPQCVLTSTVQIPLQNGLQAPVSGPQIPIAICKSTVAPKKRIMEVNTRQHKTKQTPFRAASFRGRGLHSRNSGACVTRLSGSCLMKTRRFRCPGFSVLQAFPSNTRTLQINLEDFPFPTYTFQNIQKLRSTETTLSTGFAVCIEEQFKNITKVPRGWTNRAHLCELCQPRSSSA